MHVRAVTVVGWIALLALLTGCGHAPLPPVKNSGGDGRSNFYLWQARNLYTRKVITLDSARIPLGAGQPLCIAAQSYLLPLNNGGVACVAADTLSWLAGCGVTGDSSAIGGLAADAAGNIYGTSRRTIFSLKSDGTLRWKLALPTGQGLPALLSAPLMLNGNVYACCDDSVMWCVDTTGHVRWAKHFGTSLLPQVAATGEGNIVCVLTHGIYHASDSIAVVTPDGAVAAMWEATGVRIVQGPAVYRDHITVAGVLDSADARFGVVLRYDMHGARSWMRVVEILPEGLSVDDEDNTVVNGPMLHMGATQGQIIQCDRTGSIRWYVTLEGLFPQSPALTKGYVYAVVAFPGGRAMYQFSREGKIEEIETLAGEPVAPIVDVIGRVIVGDARRGQLSVFESDIVGKLR